VIDQSTGKKTNIYSNVDFLEEIHPEVVYVGYDSKDHHLREPSLKETIGFIEQVKRFAEVRPKLLRKAHWEQ